MAYTEEQKIKIKESIIKGLYDGFSLKSILENDNDMPSRPIVYKWLNYKSDAYDAEFLNNYARARADSADLDVDKIEQLNDEVRKGLIAPAEARIIADNLKWTAGRKAPKKYGDKLDLTSDNEKLEGTKIIVQDNRTKDELDKLINEND